MVQWTTTRTATDQQLTRPKWRLDYMWTTKDYTGSRIQETECASRISIRPILVCIDLCFGASSTCMASKVTAYTAEGLAGSYVI